MKVRMMMTRWSVLVTVMLGALGALGALAAPAAAGGEVALSAGVLPSGSVDVMQAGQSASGDMDTGFLLTGAAGKWVTPQLRVAAAVALVPSARPSGLPEEAASPRLLSPGLQVDGLRPLAASGGLYAFAAVGYSRLSMPGDDAAGNGVLVAGGFGGRFMLSPELDGFVEAGYLWATHRVSQDGNDPRLDVDYFLLAAGLALDL